MREGGQSESVLALCVQQSFIHQNHAPDSSWIKGDGFVDRSSSKGSRLIILHAISKYGPLGGETDPEASLREYYVGGGA